MTLLFFLFKKFSKKIKNPFIATAPYPLKDSSVKPLWVRVEPRCVYMHPYCVNKDTRSPCSLAEEEISQEQPEGRQQQLL